MQILWWLCVAGFATSKVACCGQGPYNGLGLCTMASNLCPNRDTYAFWDAFHPTENANIIFGKAAYSSKSQSYAYPINIQQLAMLWSFSLLLQFFNFTLFPTHVFWNINILCFNYLYRFFKKTIPVNVIFCKLVKELNIYIYNNSSFADSHEILLTKLKRR